MGRLRNGSELITTKNRILFQLKEGVIKNHRGCDLTCFYNSNDLLELNFELIEENTTDKIKELKGYSEDGVGLYDKRDIHYNRLKINELVQAVNKLNKEK